MFILQLASAGRANHIVAAGTFVNIVRLSHALAGGAPRANQITATELPGLSTYVDKDDEYFGHIDQVRRSSTFMLR